MDQSDADSVASVDEQVILSQTQELCRLLHISPFKFNPYRIDWQETVNHYKAVVPVIMADECCVDPSLVTLQKDLRGALRPQDWKPLIASSLLYAFKNKRKLRRDLLTKVVAPAAAIWIFIPVGSAFRFAQCLRQHRFPAGRAHEQIPCGDKADRRAEAGDGGPAAI